MNGFVSSVKDAHELAAGKRHDWFLWNRASPLAKVGGWTDQSEQKEIVRHAFKLYPAEILKFAFRDGWKQLVTFQSSGLGLLPSKQNVLNGGGYSLFNLPVEKFYPEDASRLDQSRQTQGTFYVLRIFSFRVIWLVLYYVLLSIFAYVVKTPSTDGACTGKSLAQLPAPDQECS